MNADDLQELVEDWVRRRSFRNVRVSFARDVDYPDYQMVLECELMPEPQCAPVWIDLAHDGRYGLAIEKFERLGRAIGRTFSSPVVAAGFEIGRFSAPELIEVLDEVANGKMQFWVRRTLFGADARAVCPRTGKPYPWDATASWRLPWTKGQLVLREPWS